MSAAEIDQKQHFGQYDAQQQFEIDRINKKRAAQDDLDQRIARRGLNIPFTPDDFDPMNKVDTKTTTISGLDWKHLAVIAATALGGFGLYKFGGQSAAPTTPTVSVPPVVAPAAKDHEAKFDIRFYDKDGNLIPVPRLPQK